MLGCSKNDLSFLKIANFYALVGRKNSSGCLLKNKWLIKRQLVNGVNFKKKGKKSFLEYLNKRFGPSCLVRALSGCPKSTSSNLSRDTVITQTTLVIHRFHCNLRKWSLYISEYWNILLSKRKYRDFQKIKKWDKEKLKHVHLREVVKEKSTKFDHR